MVSVVSGIEKEQDFTEVYRMYMEDIYRLYFSFMKNQADMVKNK